MRSTIAIVLICILTIGTAALCTEEHVVLLHGLARTDKSMSKMADALEKEGYTVWNIRYPSRSNTIEAISESLQPVIASNTASAVKVHFVTHSMGGTLMHYMNSVQAFTNLGRVVMLSPPSQGSEIVDKLGHMDTYKWINGPAGDQLGTTGTNLLSRLPEVDFELGVLTGDRSVNWILSMLIPGKDDGKVSVEKAKCANMTDFRVIHATHPCIMRNKTAIQMTIHFLKTGHFPTPEDN